MATPYPGAVHFLRRAKPTAYGVDIMPRLTNERGRLVATNDHHGAKIQGRQSDQFPRQAAFCVG